MKTSERLAQFVAGHQYADLPVGVVELAKHTIADTLGCGIAGYTTAKEECRWILELVKDLGGRSEATVFLDGFRTSAPLAALANGTMIHTIDFDDTHMGSIAHFGSCLVPTVFALGERLKVDGSSLINAFVVGFEVGARVGRSMMPSHYRYWHPTSTFGSLASAAAACKLLNLDAAQTEQILGMAADEAAGLRYCIDKGDFSKSLHPGFAAMRGIMLALLGQKGATGPKGLLEYPTGFCRAFSEDPKIEKITEGLGSSYEITSNSLKAFPTILCSHSSIQAVSEVMKKNSLNASDVKRIHLRISETAKDQGKNYNPGTPLAARLSIPFCIALAVSEKKVSLGQFTEEKLKDPSIREFMKKVEVDDDRSLNERYPGTLASITEIETVNKGRLRQEVIYPKGNPKNPMSKDEVTQKFRELCSLTLPSEKYEELLSLLFGLERVSDLGQVIALLKA